MCPPGAPSYMPAVRPPASRPQPSAREAVRSVDRRRARSVPKTCALRSRRRCSCLWSGHRTSPVSARWPRERAGRQRARLGPRRSSLLGGDLQLGQLFLGKPLLACPGLGPLERNGAVVGPDALNIRVAIRRSRHGPSVLRGGLTHGHRRDHCQDHRQQSRHAARTCERLHPHLTTSSLWAFVVTIRNISAVRQLLGSDARTVLS